MIDEYYTWLIYGYHSDELSHGASRHIVVMCDECCIYRSVPMYRYSDMCKSCTNKHNGLLLSKTKLAPKEPLPRGWKQKLSDITNNKESPVYLGRIAEIILANIYSNVQVMPYGNHGFDVICNRDFKIDIKSSATGYKGYWRFSIFKNVIADFFLCIAFESRDDLYHPVHLWMIPGADVNHASEIRISKSTIDKWQQYALSLDKLRSCCNTLKA